MYSTEKIKNKLLEKYGEDHIIYKLFDMVHRDSNIIKYFNEVNDLSMISVNNYRRYTLSSNDITKYDLIIFDFDDSFPIYYERKKDGLVR